MVFIRKYKINQTQNLDSITHSSGDKKVKNAKKNLLKIMIFFFWNLL